MKYNFLLINLLCLVYIFSKMFFSLFIFKKNEKYK